MILEGRLFATVPQVAEILGYDERTVRKGIKDGSIPATQVGATARIPTAWIRQQALISEAA
jgi:excisionase family DNA binding protein